jgi:hypothetical protein
VTCENARLLHTVGFGRWSARNNNNTAADEIEIYLQNTLRLTRSLRSHRGLLTRLGFFLTRRPRLKECYRVHAQMKLLYEKYIRELKN